MAGLVQQNLNRMFEDQVGSGAQTECQPHRCCNRRFRNRDFSAGSNRREVGRDGSERCFGYLVKRIEPGVEERTEMDMEHGPASAPDDAMLALRRELLAPPDPARLEPARRADHPPRILLLYGSLRERSYSRLLVEEAARLLQVLGAEARIFDPRELPVAGSVGPDHLKVQELRALSLWSEGQVWCSPRVFAPKTLSPRSVCAGVT
jgi:hypothetical protein